MKVMLPTISVHHLIPTLPARTGNTLAIFNFQQICKLSFQLSVQIYYLLGQTEEERKAFFGGCKKEGHNVRLPPRALCCHKRWKSLSICEIWINLTPLCFLLDPLTNKHCRTRISMINLWIDSRTCQK